MGFDLYPVQANVSNPALQIQVCLYDGEDGLTPLPNVFCERIDQRSQGVIPEPAVARFRYATDDYLAANFGWPSQYEQIWPIDAQGAYVVQTDDRLVVMGFTPDGNPIVFFDGFAQIPQVAVGAAQQSVTFTAVSVETRLWDTPITDRIQRDASAPSDTSGDSDVYVQLPARFNPADTSIGSTGGYLGNSVASGSYTENDDVGTYPVFIEPLIKEEASGDTSDWWVSDAVRYLLARMQFDQGWDEWVNFPALSSIVPLLSAMEPPQGSQVLNSGDAVSSDIPIRDYDATNKAYPEVIAELLNYCGFILRFDTSTQDDGTPQTSLVISRRDNLSTVSPKPVYHAAASAPFLDPTANNVSRYTLARFERGREPDQRRDGDFSRSRRRSTWRRCSSRRRATRRHPARFI